MYLGLLLAVLPPVMGQTCYWPNGQTAANSVACPSGDDSAHSACCFSGHYCLSNGLCFEPKSLTMYRGSCTDQSFESSSCGQYCLPVTAQQCGVWTCGNGKFACNIGDCDSSNFSVPSAKLQYNKAAASDMGTILASATVTVASMTIKSTTTATATLVSDETDASGTGVSAGAAAGIGVGVGVPLAAAAAALLFLLLREKKKRRREYQQQVVETKPWAPSAYAPVSQYQPVYPQPAAPLEMPSHGRPPELQG